MYRKSRLLSSFLFLGLLATTLPATAATGDAKRVNINTADAAKLALLPRVGPAVAERILDYRKQNGPFKTAEDLMHVRGIGEKTYALIKPYVALSGESSLTEKVHNSHGTSGKSGKSEGTRH
jgi:competence protein ComEA